MEGTSVFPKVALPFVAMDRQTPVENDFRYNWLLWVRKATTSQNRLSVRWTEFVYTSAITIKKYTWNEKEVLKQPTVPAAGSEGAFGPFFSPGWAWSL